MDQPEEELEQMATWLSEQGLAPDSTKDARLCFVWRALQRTTSRLNTQRSQHLAEMAEVRKSLEQIRIFTGHKDVLAQEIQDENDQLKDQLGCLISLQDSQISEVAKMLYQQGLTELIHSSPSEQVAYLLVERASLLEQSEDPNKQTGAANMATLLGTEAQMLNTNQCGHRGAPHHSQSPWKRLFGLHKASQTKHTFIPAEVRHSDSQVNSVDRECSRLERDLEEGSRRLAMAHSEIRRLTDELESAHLTQKAYEPELQAAQQEVEQLRQEVQKLKKYEMVELRKAKELNDRLDLEIRALRSRVRTLDAEKGSLQQRVVSLQEKVEQLQVQRTAKPPGSQAAELAQSCQTCCALQEQLAAQTNSLSETEETVVSLQQEVEQLESVLQQQQLQLKQANDLSKFQVAELIECKKTCRDLENTLSAQSRCLLDTESEIQFLKQQLDTSHNDPDKLIATICAKENICQHQKQLMPKDQHCKNIQLQTQLQLLNRETTLQKDGPGYEKAAKTLKATQDECETLKKEICEALKCLDKERSKYHDMKEKHKAKLCRAKQKCDEETTWRDEKIKHLERELSLCSHSVAKEKELTISITVENEKLLAERRRLLQQLNEEERNKKDSNLTASLSKCRVDFLEMENKKLRNKILLMSNQLAVVQRSLQNKQSFHFAEGLKKTSNFLPVFKSLQLQTSSVTTPEPESDIQHDDQSSPPDVASSPLCFISGPLPRTSEMGYLNLTSPQGRSDLCALPTNFCSSDNSRC